MPKRGNLNTWKAQCEDIGGTKGGVVNSREMSQETQNRKKRGERNSMD